MTTNINSYLFQTQEEWANRGAPKETFAGAGNLWRLLSKGASQDWEGDATAKLAVRSQRQGNFGPNYSKLFSSHTTSSGEQFVVPAGKLFGVVSFGTRFLEFTRTGKNLVSAMSGKADEIDQTLGAYQVASSYLLWSDGRGGIGKGNGSYTITGNVITLQNRRSADCFEKGDVLRFVSTTNYDAAAPGSLPTPRTGTVTITAVDSDTGNLTVAEPDISAAIASAANDDWISKDVYFDDSEDEIPNGVFTWLARNSTLANTTIYGVTRSTYPARLAGRRVKIGTGTSSLTPWDICASIMQESETSGADIDTIWVPSHEVRQLMDEMSARNIIYTPVTIGMSQPANLRIAVDGMAVAFGSTRAVIMSDRYLIDPSKSIENDRQYVGLKMSDFFVKMGPTGWGFKDYDGDGSMLTRDPSTEQLYAEIGSWMALFADDTGHMIYAGVDTDL